MCAVVTVLLNCSTYVPGTAHEKKIVVNECITSYKPVTILWTG